MPADCCTAYEQIQRVGMDVPFVRARVFLLYFSGGRRRQKGLDGGGLSFAMHAAGCIGGTML